MNDVSCYKCGSRTPYMRPSFILSVSANNDNKTLWECSRCYHGYFFKSINKEASQVTNNQSPIEIIQLGEVYETHDHRKVQCVYIYANCGQAVYIFPDNPEAEPMTSDYRGKRYCGERLIIGRWKEKPVVDWSKFAAWHVATAMNSIGGWTSFTMPPYIIGNGWATDNLSGDNIPKQYWPKFNGRWQDSLCERPT